MQNSVKNANIPLEQTTNVKPGFRPELHGIRGLALGLVVVFHLFANGRVSGGIDIFLAITGFLFTGSLLRRISANNGKLDFARHFSRIGYRLLPAALLVILATAIGVYVFFPRTRWLQAANEARASALYYENWELISSQLSYEAGGPNSSPFQHFWSLSVQGQFHLVWPLLIIAIVFIARKLNWNAERLTLIAVTTVFIISFIYANYMTSTNQEVGYFHTATRIWELALGGIAGLLLPKLNWGRKSRIAAGWIGFALILTCGFFLDGATAFPGYQALWPITGLFLMLAAGHTGSPFGADRLLMTRPFTFIADISYSLYLWHWPILIFYLAATERNRPSVKGMIFVLFTSLILATLTKKYVEDPFNRGLRSFKNFRRPLITVAAMVAVVGTAGFAAGGYLEKKQTEAIAQLQMDSSEHPGAAAMLSEGAERKEYSSSPAPGPDAIAADLPQIYKLGCTQTHRDVPGSEEVKMCITGEVGAEKKVLITGGSKAAQWQPAFEQLAKQWHWELLTLEKGGCQLSDQSGPDADPQQTEACYLWNEAALELIPSLDIDLVVTIGTTSKEGKEGTPAGFTGAWAHLAEHDIPVLAVRDTPRFPFNVGECLVESAYDETECGGARSELLPLDYYTHMEGPDLPENTIPLDLTDLFCDDDFCPAVIGNVAVYRDVHHVTATYMRSLVPFLEIRLREAIPTLFD